MANNKVATAGIWYTIGNILIKGLSFLTLPLFTRLMSLSDYGLYTTYIAYESILVVIISLGLYSSLKSANLQYPNKIDNYVSTVSLLPIVSTTLLVLISLVLSPVLIPIFGFGLSFILLMIIQALGSTILTMFNCRISLDYSYKSYLLISFLSSFGNIVLSLFFILFICKDNAFAGRVYGTFLPTIILGIIILLHFFKKAKPVLSKDYIKFGLDYSLPLVPHGLSQLILAQFGKIIIQNRIGNTEAGIYGFAYTIALIPQIIVQSLALAWGPWFFEQYSQNNYESIRKRSTQYVGAFSLIIIGLILVSPEIVKVMADRSYWISIKIIGYALLGVYFTFLYGLPVEIEYYYKKTKYLAIGTIIAAVFNVVLCLVVVPTKGYEYAVYITVLTYVLYFILHMIIAKKLTGNSLPFELKRIIAYIGLVSGICIINSLIIDMWYARYILAVIVCVFLFVKNKDFILPIINYWCPIKN